MKKTPNRNVPARLALEPRIVFDGALAATAVGVDALDKSAAASTEIAAPTRTDAAAPDKSAPLVDGAAAATGTQLIFIDAAARDVTQFLQGMQGEVIDLDANRDGVQQILDALAGRTGITAIHVLSHGEPGEVHLGSSVLNAATIQGYASQLAGIGEHLTADADLLIYNNSWSQGGVRLSWNLMKLFSVPAIQRNQAQQESTDQVRRMALSMAVMTQVRIGAERYRLALEDYRLADAGAQVDHRLADYSRAAVTSRLDSELEAIRTRARAVLGDYQRMTAYAAAQVAFSRLYNSVGIDPLADNFEGDSLPVLTERVRNHLKATEGDTLPLTSNLFGHAAAVSLHVAGVDDAVSLGRMTTQVGEFLERNDIEVSEKGTPLTFTLTRTPKDGLQKASWTITAADGEGKVLGQAVHAATLPSDARQSAYEATLAAAMVANLAQVRGWVGASGE